MKKTFTCIFALLPLLSAFSKIPIHPERYIYNSLGAYGVSHHFKTYASGAGYSNPAITASFKRPQADVAISLSGKYKDYDNRAVLPSALDVVIPVSQFSFGLGYTRIFESHLNPENFMKYSETFELSQLYLSGAYTLDTTFPISFGFRYNISHAKSKNNFSDLVIFNESGWYLNTWSVGLRYSKDKITFSGYFESSRTSNIEVKEGYMHPFDDIISLDYTFPARAEFGVQVSHFTSNDLCT